MSLMNLVTKSDLSRAGLYMIAEGVVSLFISDVLPLRCRNVRLQHFEFPCLFMCYYSSKPSPLMMNELVYKVLHTLYININVYHHP